MFPPGRATGTPRGRAAILRDRAALAARSPPAGRRTLSKLEAARETVPRMRIAELFGRGRPVFSFEFFPPKTDEAANSMLGTVKDLAEMLAPDFVSVTYGAGGSTRGRTVELVSRMQSELGLTTMAHLTCVGHTRDELAQILDQIGRAHV